MQVELSHDELNLVINSLIVARDIYKTDAVIFKDENPKLAEQFLKQEKEADALADKLQDL